MAAIQMLELEKELTGPDCKAALARHDRVLRALSARLTAALDTGLPPEEFERVRQLNHAVGIARKILRLTVQDGQA